MLSDNCVDTVIIIDKTRYSEHKIPLLSRNQLQNFELLIKENWIFF